MATKRIIKFTKEDIEYLNLVEKARKIDVDIVDMAEVLEALYSYIVYHLDINKYVCLRRHKEPALGHPTNIEQIEHRIQEYLNYLNESESTDE